MAADTALRREDASTLRAGTVGEEAQPFRLSAGGLVDRGTALAFTFDGKAFRGHAGDTLASALLANGVRLVGRSFK